jgi:hypothetical protein
VLGGKANIPWKGAYSDIGSKTVKTNFGIVGKMEVILPIERAVGVRWKWNELSMNNLEQSCYSYVVWNTRIVVLE